MQLAGIHHLRTVDDAIRLRDGIRTASRVAVIGPIVEPHGTWLFETNSWLVAPAAAHHSCHAAAPAPSVA